MPLPPRKNNPLYPLPPDYQTLSSDGQRAARINACTSWFDPSKPKEVISDSEAFVVGFRFWKEYYRKGWKGNQAKYFLRSPDFHDQWIREVAYQPHCIITSFRRSAKTFIFGEELPEFLVLTRPNTVITYTSSAEDLTAKQVRAVRLDLEQNELIEKDFGRMKGSNQRSLKWTQSHIELVNHSAMVGVSADQAQRGITALSQRPVIQLLDDWEIDKRLRNPELRSNAEDWLFDVFFPCAEPWARRIWTNTILGIRSWAMIASHKEDPRFEHWSASQYDLLRYTGLTDKDGEPEVESIWPELTTAEEAKQMRKTGGKGIIGYGESVFSKEWMNDPKSKSESAFDYNDKFHGFTHERTIKNEVIYLGNDKEERRDYADLEKKSTRVIGVDLALGVAGGDYSGLVVAAIDTDNVMWILDEYCAREAPVETLKALWDMVDKWNVDFIGIERVNFDQLAIDYIVAELNTRMGSNGITPHLNVVKRGGGHKKEIRIMGLQYRFVQNKIRLEAQCSNTIDQVRFWTPTGGQLKHDDLLDALVCCEETFLRIGGPAWFDVRPEPTNIDKYREAVKLGVRPNPGLDHIPIKEIREEQFESALKEKEREPDMDLFAGVWTEDEFF